MTVDERDDVGMVQASQDSDLGDQVVFEFLVELGDVDRFDGDGLPFLL